MLMKFALTSSLAIALLLGTPTTDAAAQQTLEQRLHELEKAYTDLIVRDREKDQELERLRGEVSALRRGDRTGGGDHHGHGHGAAQDSSKKSGHGHAHDSGHDEHHDNEGHAHGAADVLMETEHVRLYMPSFGLDLVGYKDDSDPVLEERLETLNGFGGHAHGDGEDDGHGVLSDGFNLRHAEVGFAVEAIGFGRGQVLINGTTDGVELEEAFVKTVPVFDVASFKAGKFRSNFGFFNELHSPEWEFADAPLPHFLIFGDHGLEGTGVQGEFSTPQFPVRLGLEGY